MLDTSTPPLRLGNYEPLLELASGGMATVYIARQIGAAGFERIVVVKRVHRHLLGNREFYDMFRDEAGIASLVRHPNVVPVIDVVEVSQPDRELFLVMEYVESSSLSTLRKVVHDAGQRIPLPILSRILFDTLSGLHAAHEAVDMRGQPLGVVHRDVSPQNIIVGVDGSTRLIDFGVAKASRRLTETKSGSVKGKYSYMAPEQARGQAVDRRTDIFAAGVVLHECLTDRRLFRGDNELDTVRRIMEDPIAAPSSIQSGIPAALDAVALKALARPPDERFSSALEMMEALEAAMPLASPREVAAYIEQMCGQRLAERREALQKMIAGQVAPLAVELSREPGESQSSRSIPMMGMPLPSLPPPSSSRPNIALVIAIAIAALALGALAFIVTRDKAPQPVAAPSHTSLPPAATSAPAPSMVTSGAPKTDITVELTADGPIETINIPGSKHFDIEGNVAHVALDPWATPLKVEATLVGGKKVVATLDPGSQTVHLAPPKKPGNVVITAPPATNKPDLQGSPY